MKICIKNTNLHQFFLSVGRTITIFVTFKYVLRHEIRKKITATYKHLQKQLCKELFLESVGK